MGCGGGGVYERGAFPDEGSFFDQGALKLVGGSLDRVLLGGFFGCLLFDVAEESADIGHIQQCGEKRLVGFPVTGACEHERGDDEEGEKAADELAESGARRVGTIRIWDVLHNAGGKRSDAPGGTLPAYPESGFREVRDYV